MGEENGPETFGAGQYETILEKMRAEGCSEDRVAILKMLFDELRKSSEFEEHRKIEVEKGCG